MDRQTDGLMDGEEDGKRNNRDGRRKSGMTCRQREVRRGNGVREEG